MKNIKLPLLALFCILFFNACGSEDEPPMTPPDENIKLEGKWIVKEINFTSNVKAWEGETFTNVMDIFGWAPYMYGSASGVEFTNEDYKDSQKSGKVFKIITGSSYGGSGKTFWIWTPADNGKAFEVIQLNNQMPPYDFSMSKTTSLKEATLDGKRVLTFTTTLVSIDQDKKGESTNPMARPKVAATATFILVETSGTIDSNVAPTLKLNGAELKLPTQVDPTVVTKENLKGTAWLLKSGSKIYDPAFGVQNPAFEFSKLITLNFADENTLKLRYSFPMGIVSTKETKWEYHNETNIVSYVKPEGMMESSIMKFVWKASYLITDDKKSLILELKEVINNAGKENETKLDISTVEINLLKREFVGVATTDVDDKSTAVNKSNYVIFK